MVKVWRWACTMCLVSSVPPEVLWQDGAWGGGALTDGTRPFRFCQAGKYLLPDGTFFCILGRHLGNVTEQLLPQLLQFRQLFFKLV